MVAGEQQMKPELMKRKHVKPGSRTIDAQAPPLRVPCVKGAVKKCGCGATLKSRHDVVLHEATPGPFCHLPIRLAAAS